MKVNTYILQTVTYVFKANTNFWDKKKIVFWLSCSLHLLLIINISCKFNADLFISIFYHSASQFDIFWKYLLLMSQFGVFFDFFLSFLRSKFICYLKKNKPPNSLPYILYSLEMFKKTRHMASFLKLFIIFYADFIFSIDILPVIYL